VILYRPLDMPASAHQTAWWAWQIVLVWLSIGRFDYRFNASGRLNSPDGLPVMFTAGNTTGDMLVF